MKTKTVYSVKVCMIGVDMWLTPTPRGASLSFYRIDSRLFSEWNRAQEAADLLVRIAPKLLEYVTIEEIQVWDEN